MAPFTSPTDTGAHLDGVAARSHCVAYWQENDNGRWYATSILIGLFLVPLLIMTVAYVLIFKQLSDKAKKLRGSGCRDSSYQEGCQQHVETLCSPAACWKRTLMSLKKNRSEVQLALEKKLAITVLIVIGVFLLCWLPFFALNVWAAFKQQEIPSAADFITSLLAYGNSAFNPLIYGLKNKKFLKTFKAILTCKNPRQSTRPTLSRSASVPVISSSSCISRQTLKRTRSYESNSGQRKRVVRTKSEGDEGGLSDFDNLTVVSAPGISTAKSTHTKQRKVPSTKSSSQQTKRRQSCRHSITHKTPVFSHTNRLGRSLKSRTAPTSPIPLQTTGLIITTDWRTQQQAQHIMVARKPAKDTLKLGTVKRSPRKAELSISAIKQNSCTIATHHQQMDAIGMWGDIQPKSPTQLLNCSINLSSLSMSESHV